MVSRILVIYLAFSLLTYAAYWKDKRAAQSDRRRIPEMSLLVLGAVGGWPGGFVAQQVLRHKTRKLSFLILFWASAALNIALLSWILKGGFG